MSTHLALYFHHAAFQDVKAPELWERIQATGSHAWYSKAVEYWDRYADTVSLQVARTALSHPPYTERDRSVVQPCLLHNLNVTPGMDADKKHLTTGFSGALASCQMLTYGIAVHS